jgi:hypothetical protein
VAEIERHDTYLVMRAGPVELHFANGHLAPARGQAFLHVPDAGKLWTELKGSSVAGIGPSCLLGKDHSGWWLRSQSAQVTMPRLLPGPVSDMAPAPSLIGRGSGNGSVRTRRARICRH